jgi:hypothetical protein
MITYFQNMAFRAFYGKTCHMDHFHPTPTQVTKTPPQHNYLWFIGCVQTLYHTRGTTRLNTPWKLHFAYEQWKSFNLTSKSLPILLLDSHN